SRTSGAAAISSGSPIRSAARSSPRAWCRSCRGRPAASRAGRATRDRTTTPSSTGSSATPPSRSPSRSAREAQSKGPRRPSPSLPHRFAGAGEECVNKSLARSGAAARDCGMHDTLFPMPEASGPSGPRMDGAVPRVQRPNRQQVELRAMDLEAQLPEEHRARVVWEFVEGLDLTPLYEAIKAVEGHGGRPAIDPAILMAVWLYATLEGVGSARAVERLCEEHDAYRWLCGGVSVNYHTLADFRVGHPEVLDGLLTTSVAALMAEGLVELTRVAQDGVKVR